MAHGAAFIGSLRSPIEGIDINLVGVGLDARNNIVFIVNDGYQQKFGVSETLVGQIMDRLADCSMVLLSVREAA